MSASQNLPSGAKGSTRTVTRRHVLRSAPAFGAGVLFIPSSVFGRRYAPSDRLNVAFIASWGRARAHFGAARNENVVALCDVDERHLGYAAKTFPNAKKYVDWRKCLDRPDLDAVICSTTDHTHAFVATWAMNRGLHVYCEKPLGNSVEEARVVRKTYMKYRDKIATQVGTQRHANPNFNRVREAILDGAVGTLKHVHAWGNRQIRRSGYLPPAGDPPSYLHYDLWIGPTPWHPYNPGYFGGCLKWNMYWDFGSGQVGDMGSHTIDLAWNAIDATLPTSASAFGEKFNPDVTPVELTATFEIPANDWRPAIRVTWYQGGHMPKNPRPDVNLRRIGHGVMFEGDKGYLVASFGNMRLYPRDDAAGLSHYKPRPKEKQIPPMGNFQAQWVNACKGNLKTACDFVYGGTAIEMMLLGLVAYRAGKKLTYDGATGKITNDDAANELLQRKYRKGWILNG